MKCIVKIQKSIYSTFSLYGCTGFVLFEISWNSYGRQNTNNEDNREPLNQCKTPLMSKHLHALLASKPIGVPGNTNNPFLRGAPSTEF